MRTSLNHNYSYLLRCIKSEHGRTFGERFPAEHKIINEVKLTIKQPIQLAEFKHYIRFLLFFPIKADTPNMNKRKVNEIDERDRSPSVAVSSVEPQLEETSWTDCLKRLAIARNHLSQEDPVLSTIAILSGYAVTFENEAKKAADEADEECARLMQQVEEATETCKQESQHLKQLTALLNKYRIEQNMLSQQIQECNDTFHDLRQQTERFKVEALEDMDGVEQLKERQLLEVTRLRHQISLYALCSGIKWDYSEEGILAGEVVSTE